jgi:lipoprotein signal peptidase
MRNLLKVILIWIPLLLVDRITRYIAMTSFNLQAGVWVQSGNWSVAFVNAFHIYAPTAPLLEWLGYGIQFVLIATLIGMAYYLRINQPLLLPLAIFLGGVCGNTADWLVWGMVSDPLMIKYSADVWRAINFNLADCYILLGFVSYVIALWRNAK